MSMDAIFVLKSSLSEILSARNTLVDHRDSIEVAIDNMNERIINLRVAIALSEKTGGSE